MAPSRPITIRTGAPGAHHGMIEQTDQLLKEWVGNVLGQVTISFAPPEDKPSGEGVNLYLLELLPTPPASSSRVSPRQFSVRYLVSTWGDDPIKAHRLLGELTLAAMEHEEMEVDLEAVSAETWNALRVIPRPAFYLRLLVRQARPDPDARYVKQPLVLQAGPAITLVGRVEGPGGIPIAGARVEFPSLNRATYTNARGQFTFATIPVDLPVHLVVKAKGRTQPATVDRPTSEANPAVISLKLD